MERSRLRKSPSRYEAVLRSRSKSRSQKEDKSEKTKKKIPYKEKSPTRKSERVARSNAKSKSPSKPSKVANALKKIELIRDSLTPDRKMVEEVVRSSVQKFEEVATDMMTSVRKLTRSTFKDEFEKNQNAKGLKDSDSDVTVLPENNVKETKKTTQNYTGFVKTLLALFMMFFYPALVFLSYVGCVSGNCSLVPNVTFSHVKVIDKDAAVWYTGFLLSQFILATLPLGFKSDGTVIRGTRLMYRNNGIGTLFVTLGVFTAIYYYTSFPLTKLLDKSVPFLFMATVYAVFLSVVLYVKSVYQKVVRNPLGNTGYFVYDFWTGGEVNPRVGPLDFKTVVLRTSFVTLVLLNCLFALKEVESVARPSEFSVPLMVVCAFQVLFALDFLMFENSFLSTYTVTQEGTGYFFLIWRSILPFWLALLPKYLQTVEVFNNFYVVMAASLMYLVGYIVYRVSSEQKAKFLKHHRVDKLQDIVQERRFGSNLFRGGLWGFVRHPNYTGFLLMQMAWGLLCGGVTQFHWVPFVIPLFAIFEHLYQVTRVEERSFVQHPTAWVTYTMMVKSRLIPRVF
ncbi:delta(14)-sterol reductase [Cimex lectularius]|uniref:Lamin-B receptor n=1 Tax=Cimex lectularius TaxID=79782 RepID=A0A8I6SJH4_CIMLE|nr:delta(14)-sterol reductase [Cimex lectularius]XP_024083604.1 delta(14)-sterol reductase [Cimex lectularius]XP_024083605.1 delta(14)-sterol reductase [Cimex lectularius]